MQCLYCGTPLAILRMLASGSFCSDEHRELHERNVAPPLQEAVPNVLPARRRWRGNRITIALPERLSLKRWAFPVLDAVPSFGPAPHSEPQVVALSSTVPASLAKPKPRKGKARILFTPQEPDPGRSQRILLPAVDMDAASSWPPFGRRVPLLLPRANPPGPNQSRIKAAVTPAENTAKPLVPRLQILPHRLKKMAVKRRPQPDTPEELKGPSLRNPIDLSSQKLREIWRNAPGDLKIVAMVIPMVLLLTLNAAGPKLYTKPLVIKAASQPMLDGILTREWHAIRQTIARRAGVDYVDDFRSGLDSWTSGSHAEMKWTYDTMGFVRPGTLALFRPTLQLADYHVEFTGRFEQKAMGFVFRATDAANYQAVKLVLGKTGLIPEVHLVRYTVLNGREGPRSDKLLPFNLASDAFFTVNVDVRGNDFTLMIQDKMADFWTDDRLKTGGIGFFGGKGESACLRHVEVTYQNDTLGRFCAFLAPEPEDSNNGS